LERVEFKPVDGFWFTTYLIDYIYSREGCFEATLDLGVSKKVVCRDGSKLHVDNLEIDLDLVKPSRVDSVVYYGVNGVYEVEARSSNGYYKLKAIGLDKAPTIEINGIHMHRIIGVDPWIDSKIKVLKLGVRKGDLVLDTCMGLGYTAINAMMRGARVIYTFEIDSHVIWIATHNPWSRGLSSENIIIYNMDVIEGLRMFSDSFFDKILHDPPRYSGSTGDLYSLDFYRELYRVLKPGGRLFHYTGEPGKHRRLSIVKGIGERLRKAGFHPVIYDHESAGYIAYKPRV